MSEFLTILIVIVCGNSSMWSFSSQSELKRELQQKNQQIRMLEARTDGLITGCLGGK
jgi:predicted amino acid-binding ACT domain protein